MTTKCGPVEFFDLSKLFWFVVAPIHLLVWALAIGVIFQRWLFGRVFLIFGALSFLGLLLLPIGDWAMSTVEGQYMRGPWPAHIDGVLEIGGGIKPGVLGTRA